jgi:hypothetical protein
MPVALKVLPDPPLDILRARLEYNPLSGVFTWKVNGYHNTTVAGDVAGSISHWGYIVISIRLDGRHHRIFAHRLAWAFVHGAWPIPMIDHHDGAKTFNAIANLREADHSLNGQNQRRAPSNNRSCGLLGVSPTASGRWRSGIFVNKRRIHLGCFDTAEVAHQAYIAAKRRLHAGNTL